MAPPNDTTSSDLTQVPVGSLACQRDPYLQSLRTTCISCSDKPNKQGFYEVKLVDTVLFPEGGGQPHDTGVIGTVAVHDVQRRGLDHVHFTKDPVEQGSEVDVVVDWDRRWDHMQQHSGQHLLSAVLEKEAFGAFETVSWNLGDARSHIELATTPTHTPTPAQLAAVEAEVNRLIRLSVPVRTVTTSASDDSARPDTLPKDYVGAQGVVRTVYIGDLDANPCCGTHVSGLMHLQVVKLLHTERAKGTNTRLFFLVGERVLRTFGETYAVTRKLTTVLSGGQETFVENAERLVKEARTQTKTVKNLLKEIAGYVAVEMVGRLEAVGYATHHREDADMDYLSALANLLKEKGALIGERIVMLSAGEKGAGGPVIVLGEDEGRVKEVIKGITEVLDGVKGGGKGRWQGRVKTWKGLEKAWGVVGGEK